MLASTALRDDQKREAADLLNELTENTAKPPEQRRAASVMKAIAAGFEHLVGNAHHLVALWTAIAPRLGF